MVLIYSPHSTARHAYTFRQIFNVFLNVEFKVVSSINEFTRGNNFLINYSGDGTIDADLFIKPNGLLDSIGSLEKKVYESNTNLLDDEIHKVIPIEGQGEHVKLFSYPPTNPNDAGFDIFTAVFWMLTRYEEYEKFVPDSHGRFPATGSLAYKNNFLEIPVVDVWVNQLADRINTLMPSTVKKPLYKVINTIDVDNVFAFKGKAGMRNIGAFAKHLLKGETKKYSLRKKVMKGTQKDPFDTYDYIKSIHDKFGLKTYFFHLSARLGKHDRNILPSSPAYRELLGKLKLWSVQGLHPSYASNLNKVILKENKWMLENALAQTVWDSRQHFLKVEFPISYRNLIEQGITTDFSLGFADAIGFRAGTGRAFYFYDLLAENESALLLQPLCVMDSSLRDYMKLSPQQAIQRVRVMQDRLKKEGSTYVAIWHNETLGEANGWEGWREVYEAQFS